MEESQQSLYNRLVNEYVGSHNKLSTQIAVVRNNDQEALYQETVAAMTLKHRCEVKLERIKMWCEKVNVPEEDKKELAEIINSEVDPPVFCRTFSKHVPVILTPEHLGSVTENVQDGTGTKRVVQQPLMFPLPTATLNVIENDGRNSVVAIKSFLSDKNLPTKESLNLTLVDAANLQLLQRFNGIMQSLPSSIDNSSASTDPMFIVLESDNNMEMEATESVMTDKQPLLLAEEMDLHGHVSSLEAEPIYGNCDEHLELGVSVTPSDDGTYRDVEDSQGNAGTENQE